MKKSTITIIITLIIITISVLVWFVVPKSKLLIKVNESSYSLQVDGKDYTSENSQEISLRSGGHVYSVSKEGYKTQTGVAQTSDLKTTVIEVNLTPISLIEREYTQFKQQFGDAEVTQEFQPKTNWLVVSIKQNTNPPTKKLIVLNKINGEWKIIVEGVDYITPDKLNKLPIDISNWLKLKNFVNSTTVDLEGE